MPQFVGNSEMVPQRAIHPQKTNREITLPPNLNGVARFARQPIFPPKKLNGPSKPLHRIRDSATRLKTNMFPNLNGNALNLCLGKIARGRGLDAIRMNRHSDSLNT
jgi:hypothetical protein